MSISLSLRRDWIPIVLLAFCALQIDSTRASQADDEPQAWRHFVAPIEAVFVQKLEHFQVLGENAFPREINDLRLNGKGRLIAQWREGEAYVPVGDDLDPRVAEAFRQLGLFGVRSDDEMIQIAPAVPFPVFRGIPVATTIDYAPGVRLEPLLCNATTITEQRDGGRCWWPLPEPGWYVDFIWPEHDPGSP